MTLALFPTTPVPDVPYNVTDTFRTLSSPEFDAGKQYFKSLRNYPIFSANLTYGEHSSWSDISTLYTFFMDCKGTATSFDFRDFNGHDNTPKGIAWAKLYVGVGTGATTTFDVPMYSSSTYKLYIDGIDQVANEWTSGGFSGSMWKFNAGGTKGANDRDKLTFATAPAAGKVLEWKATGQRMVAAHFTTDNISINAFAGMLASTGLAIKETR